MRFKGGLVTALLVAHSAWAQEGSIGSLVPCAVPLPWRVADLDPRFGLDRSEAVLAVEEAAALWEEATGADLFVHDPTRGLPVGFEFDDRQAMLQLRARFTQELAAADQGLAARAAELTRMNERFAAVQAELEERAEQLRQRTEAHNDEVRRWNERGGAPPLVLEEIQRGQQLLRAERESLEVAERELRQLYEWIRGESDRLNRGIQDRNRQARDGLSELPLRASESGRYDESVQTRNGEVVSVEREIHIFRFADRDELLLVIAHELGHALGVGHAAAPGAVMSEVVGVGGDFNVAGIQASDVDMLRSRCPAL